MFPVRLVRYLVATLLCPLVALAEPLPDPDRAERASVSAALGWLARHQELDGRWFTAIQITTAAGICGAVDLLLGGKLPNRGFVKQEQVPLPAFLQNRFGRYYA